MKAALIERGVPADALTLDDAGFRTLDSVVRAKEVFGQRKLTVITDRFHAYRAVFLAEHYGIDAVAYPSAEVEMRWSFKARTRECFADVRGVPRPVRPAHQAEVSGPAHRGEGRRALALPSARDA